MTPRKLWPILWIVILPGFAFASGVRSPLRLANLESLATHERQLWRAPIHSSEFADVPHASARSRCERTHPPEAPQSPNAAPALTSAFDGFSPRLRSASRHPPPSEESTQAAMKTMQRPAAEPPSDPGSEWGLRSASHPPLVCEACGHHNRPGN